MGSERNDRVIKAIRGYRLTPKQWSRVIRLEPGMEFTINTVSLSRENDSDETHIISIQYNYDEASQKYDSVCEIARLIPDRVETCHTSLYLDGKDKVRIVLSKGKTQCGPVDVFCTFNASEAREELLQKTRPIK